MDMWPAVGAYTALSVAAAAWRINVVGQGEFLSQGGSSTELAVADAATQYGSGVSGVGIQQLDHLLGSPLSTAVIINLAANAFLLLSLIFQSVFLGELTLQEVQKLAERVINYVLFKVLFLTTAVDIQVDGILWVMWFSALGFLKVFSGLARDRFERLCAAPMASTLAHTRTLSLLLVVLALDLACIDACIRFGRGLGWSHTLLLTFEAVIIALDTCQTVVQYVIHLAESHTDVASIDSTFTLGGRVVAWVEWKGSVLFWWNACCDVCQLALTLLHYCHVWYLHGLAFHLVDALLFLNCRALITTLLRRVNVAVRYLKAIRNLRSCFPDATPQQLQTFGDDCAICKEPMATAKRLPCTHLFHLSCLRSWLDQGSAATYSCPTCRTPLVDLAVPAPPPPSVMPPQAPAAGGDNLAAARSGQDWSPIPAAPHQPPHPIAMAPRGRETESSGSTRWQADGDTGTLTWRPAADSGVRPPPPPEQWWWPFGPPDGMAGPPAQPAPPEPSPPAGAAEPLGLGLGFGSGLAGQLRRSFIGRAFLAQQERIRARALAREQLENARLEAMVTAVLEILPQTPRQAVIQDLRRTHSVAHTVSRFLEGDA